jgi:hypothetical protein
MKATDLIEALSITKSPEGRAVRGHKFSGGIVGAGVGNLGMISVENALRAAENLSSKVDPSGESDMQKLIFWLRTTRRNIQKDREMLNSVGYRPYYTHPDRLDRGSYKE